MLVIPLLIAPSLVLAATWMEQRRGASAGGWVAALPVSLPVGLVAISLQSGVHVADRLVWSAAAHVAPQLVYGAVLAACIRRGRTAAGLAGGALIYVACSVVVAAVPAPLAVAAAVPCLLLAPRLVPVGASAPAAPPSPVTTALTCLGAPLVVAAAVVGSRAAGPAVGGALAAFPTVSTLLAVALVHRSGAGHGVQALAGLVRSLPCYLTFCLLATVLLPGVGPIAIPFALLACLLAGRVTWRTLPAAASA